MTESSSHNSSSHEITPKEEPVTLAKPESPKPFLPATQEAFTRVPTQYKEYLSKFWYTTKTLEDSKVWVSTLTGGVRGDIGGKTGGLDQISNKDATILYCLANGIQVDYAKLIWEDLIHKLNKKTREKIVPYPSSPKQKPRAKSILRRKQFLKQTSESTTEASKSKIGQSETKTKSISSKDKSPSHPSPLILVVGEMHKGVHQAAGGPTSLGATSIEGAYPQLNSGHDALADSTAEADHGLSAPNDSIFS
nr:hypothetical protein [Tanacetum cinerariifolium]